MPKPESAKLTLNDFNEHVEIETINEFLTWENA